jgi:hypothetical protein
MNAIGPVFLGSTISGDMTRGLARKVLWKNPDVEAGQDNLGEKVFLVRKIRTTRRMLFREDLPLVSDQVIWYSAGVTLQRSILPVQNNLIILNSPMGEKIFLFETASFKQTREPGSRLIWNSFSGYKVIVVSRKTEDLLHIINDALCGNRIEVQNLRIRDPSE